MLAWGIAALAAGGLAGGVAQAAGPVDRYEAAADRWGIAALAAGGLAGGVAQAASPVDRYEAAADRAGPPVPAGVPAGVAGRTPPVRIGARDPAPIARGGGWRVGALALALGGGRGRRTRGGGLGDNRLTAMRTGRWRVVQDLAAAVDWTLAGGALRLGGDRERSRRADPGDGCGGASMTITTVALVYRDRAGWSFGGGWRAVAPGARGLDDDRLRALAAGLPPAAAGAFAQASLALGDGASVQVEAAVARLEPGYAALLGEGFDRRAVVTLRRPFS